jgi:hypothetical protein
MESNGGIAGDAWTHSVCIYEDREGNNALVLRVEMIKYARFEKFGRGPELTLLSTLEPLKP